MKRRFASSWGKVRAKNEVDLRLNLGMVTNCVGVGQVVHPAIQFPNLQNGIDSATHWPCRKRKWTLYLEDVSFLDLLYPEPLASLWHFFLFDPPSCQWQFSSLLLFSSVLFLFSRLPKGKWYLFSALFFRRFSLAGWCHSPSPSVNRTILIKIKPPWDPRRGHLELLCVEPDLQRDRPSWRTFELKRMFLFTTSFQLNKGKLKDLHLNSRNITLYIYFFTVTLEQWTIPGKRLLWPFQENELQLIKDLTQLYSKGWAFWGDFLPGVIVPGSVRSYLCLIAFCWLKEHKILPHPPPSASKTTWGPTQTLNTNTLSIFSQH